MEVGDKVRIVKCGETYSNYLDYLKHYANGCAGYFRKGLKRWEGTSDGNQKKGTMLCR